MKGFTAYKCYVCGYFTISTYDGIKCENCGSEVEFAGHAMIQKNWSFDAIKKEFEERYKKVPVPPPTRLIRENGKEHKKGEFLEMTIIVIVFGTVGGIIGNLIGRMLIILFP